VAETKHSTIAAPAVFLADPPPEILRPDEFERVACRDLGKLAHIDPVAVALEQGGSLVEVIHQETGVTWLVETAHRPPGFSCYKNVLGMALRCALVSELGLKNVEECGLISAAVAGFLDGQATRDLSADKPDPSLGREIDPCNTPVVVFIGVRKTENPVDAHRADLPPELRSRDDE
jgi:hypothetical protein